jgi:nucleotide-binding universal stress UspA family protein
MASVDVAMPFKRILVPVDGSPTSARAVSYAIHLAKLEGAELVLLHVIENIKQGGAIGLQARYGNQKIIQGFRKAREDSAEKWMSRIVREAEGKGIPTKTKVLTDDGSSEAGAILEYSQNNNVDLIVIGSKGQSKFKSLLVGSVANTVLNHADCPVMVIR